MFIGRKFNSLILSSLRCNLENSFQFYSVFPPNYIKPIYKKDEQEALYQEETELKQFSYSPVQPAKTNNTCSEFHDELIRKFTNYIMRKGDKKMARKILDETFENIKIKKLDEYYNTPPEYRENIILDPKVIFYQAVENCTPVLELQKISRGGIAYQVPIPMNENRAQFLSMNWIIRTAQNKGNAEKLSDVLAKEIIDAAKNQGRVIKKKYDLHKQCEANRAYAHYRWL
ncbi:28S ribosomal protein S7, mitochondrial [Melipona quadrifasciata]|uniref:28S ribosomal protein S7, mitochondrial n=1 Tax=Melipona quadrifasciata TaxID=166423 RepID=A0A0M8ZQF0_9HYME|nr:28S ribosomal protein S7, mitochondrial [Melipona quadrifasciata]